MGCNYLGLSHRFWVEVAKILHTNRAKNCYFLGLIWVLFAVDLGIPNFAITSTGSKYPNPQHIKKHESNLKRKQRKISRKVKGSNSRNKARKLVARVHQRISNSRQDFWHQLSHKLVNENQVIVVEDLAVKNMVKNHCKRCSFFSYLR